MSEISGSAAIQHIIQIAKMPYLMTGCVSRMGYIIEMQTKFLDQALDMESQIMHP